MMRDTRYRLDAFEIIPEPDSKVSLKVTLPICLNNIGQRLSELMDSYRFCYFGIDAPDESIIAYKKAFELGFPYATKDSIAERRKTAELLINRNFTVNLIEIINEEIIEIVLMMTAIRMIKSKTADMDLPNTLDTLRKKLQRLFLPALLKELVQEIGPLPFADYLSSINQVRNILVHRAGVVDSDSQILKLYVPQILADYSIAELLDPTTHIQNITLCGKAIVTEWKRSESISMDYELCIKIAFTVLSFFGNVINVVVPKKYPEFERQISEAMQQNAQYPAG